jgi:hypothetical protein
MEKCFASLTRPMVILNHNVAIHLFIISQTPLPSSPASPSETTHSFTHTLSSRLTRLTHIMKMTPQLALAILAWFERAEGRALPQPQFGTATALGT